MGGTLAFVLLFAVAIVCVLTRLDAIVKAAIEKYGSAATATAVRVESVRIRLREGSGTVRGITIANLRGFEGKHAFSLGETGVAIEVGSITRQIVGELCRRATAEVEKQATARAIEKAKDEVKSLMPEKMVGKVLK